MSDATNPRLSKGTRRRIAASAAPADFRCCLAFSEAAIARGEDPTELPIDVSDPVALAAEIEALAGARTTREGSK